MIEKLPKFLRDKIDHTAEDHWVWTGYVVPEKPGRRKLRVDNTDDGRKRGPRGHDDYPLFYNNRRKAEPRVNRNGRSVPAKRVVISAATGIPYEDVTRVRQTCTHDLCVNPDHHVGSWRHRPSLTLQDLIQSGEDPELSIETLSATLGGTISLEVYEEFQRHVDD